MFKSIILLFCISFLLTGQYLKLFIQSCECQTFDNCKCSSQKSDQKDCCSEEKARREQDTVSENNCCGHESTSNKKQQPSKEDCNCMLLSIQFSQNNLMTTKEIFVQIDSIESEFSRIVVNNISIKSSTFSINKSLYHISIPPLLRGCSLLI